MKYIKEYIVPFSIAVFSLVLLCLCKSAPASKLWRGYSILYVPIEADWAEVSKILRDVGCDEVIDVENQYVPLEISEKTPEVSLSFLSIEKSDYLTKRNLYFFDKSNRYRICYVPDSQLHSAEKAVFEMNRNGILAGMNGNAAFPFIVPIACLVFAVLLVLFSHKRKSLAILLFLPVFFSFSQAFYSSAVISCLFMYVVYLFIEIGDRTGALLCIFRNVAIVLFLAISFLAAIFNGIECSLLFIGMTFGVAALTVLLSNYEKFLNSKKMFVSVKIIPAKMISLSTKKSRGALLIFAALTVCVLLSASFSSSVSQFGSASNIVVPGPSYSLESLPTINDYVDWRWETMTFPYISLNGRERFQRPKRGSKIVFTEYDDSSGIIEPLERSIEYNSDFVSNAMAVVDGFDYPALEKFLKAQNNTSTGYVSSGNIRLSLSTIMFLLLAIFISVGLYIVQRHFRKTMILGGRG